MRTFQSDKPTNQRISTPWVRYAGTKMFVGKMPLFLILALVSKKYKESIKRTSFYTFYRFFIFLDTRANSKKRGVSPLCDVATFIDIFNICCRCCCCLYVKRRQWNWFCKLFRMRKTCNAKQTWNSSKDKITQTKEERTKKMRLMFVDRIASIGVQEKKLATIWDVNVWSWQQTKKSSIVVTI